MSSRLKVIMALLAAALMMVLSACGDGEDAATAQGDAPTKYGNCEVSGTQGQYKLTTKESGVLTVGTVLPIPGYFNGETPDTIADGYEYCIAANIAHRAGLKLKVANVSFERVIAGNTGDIDMLMAGVSVTDERKKVVDFSTPYDFVGGAVLTRSDSDIDEKTIAQAKIGVLSGGIYIDFLKRHLGVKVRAFAAPADMQVALMSGQIDAIVNDITTVMQQAKASNGALKVVGQYESSGLPVAIVLDKDSPNTKTVDEILGALIKEGQVERSLEKYLVPLLGGNPKDIPAWTS